MNALGIRPAGPTEAGRERVAAAHMETPRGVPNPISGNEENEQGDLEELESPVPDDASWEVFVADDDEWDPLPEPGDFWMGD